MHFIHIVLFYLACLLYLRLTTLYHQSAMALRNLLGPITFEPIYPDIGKLYYVVNTGINALKITAPLTDLVSSDNGADSFLWWSQAGSNRRPLQCHCSALPTELWPRLLYRNATLY